LYTLSKTKATRTYKKSSRTQDNSGLKVRFRITRFVGRHKTVQQQVLPPVVGLWLFSGAATWKQRLWDVREGTNAVLRGVYTH
jgi:hypothetical protein